MGVSLKSSKKALTVARDVLATNDRITISLLLFFPFFVTKVSSVSNPYLNQHRGRVRELSTCRGASRMRFGRVAGTWRELETLTCG